jgi:hypothetical protein
MSTTPKFFEIDYSPAWIGEVVSVLAFTLLGWLLYRTAAVSRKAARG